MDGSILHWTDYFKAIGPTLIAVFVAYIALRQWQTAKATLRERLFDRRFEVFKKTQRFLSAIQSAGEVTDKDFSEFLDAPQLAVFLFDQNIADYLKKISDRAFDLRRHARRTANPKSEEDKSEAVELEAETLAWLSNQLPEIFSVFRPYFSFGKKL